MSEKLSHKPEQQHDNPETQTSPETRKNLERLNEAAKEAARSPMETNDAQQTVEQHAKAAHETSVETETKSSAHPDQYIHLKQDTYKQTLRRVQSKLNTPERALSKAMHNPVVDRVSEGLGKTIARPSGILGGGVFALLGSTFVLYMAKTYGFRYNFSLFVILMIAGFTVGLLFEYFVRLIRKKN